ncbi:MAG TPA: glycosyltransferase N-terminal domain-containing protein [Gemmatimonadaceae bacterium]|nr:glycosyltransferase N-terminal domain-containing protein [Gemmatimonadaceae bacterium]
MNSLLRAPYAAAGLVAHALVQVVPAGDSKFQRALSSRRGIIDRYRSWSAASRDASRRLVWFHAPSVGEGLQAAPVIQLIRSRLPDTQIAYTFYSPSAQRFAATLGADFADYLPFDTYADALAIIHALKPTALVFSKLDVWPALTESAAGNGVRVGVISATLPESSARRGVIARHFLGDAYQSLHSVGAIDGADAKRLREQGVRPDRIAVTGDTRYDQVWARAQRPSPSVVDSLGSSRPTLVAGSTWASDEAHLFPAWMKIRDKVTDARLIIAPHELTASHFRGVESWARRSSLTLDRLDAASGNSDVVLVDKFGILGDLYALADVAYVGGGFQSAGLHSVLEPAAYGVPVLFGPRNEKSRDPRKLIEAGGGAEIAGTTDLAIRLGNWLGSSAARDAAGNAAKTLVMSERGAAERSFELVRSLLDRPGFASGAPGF